MGLGFAKIQLFEKIVENTWGKDKKHFTKDDVLYVLQESEDIKKYLTNYKTINRRGYSIFRYFVEYLLYRNLANYDSMVLITSEKGCLTDDTLIEISTGKTIKKIAIKNLVNKGTINVNSYNIKTKKFEIKKSDGVVFVKKAKICKLISEKGKILKGTYDHPILLPSGKYRLMAEFKSGDEFITNDGIDKIKKTQFLKTLQNTYDVVNVSDNENFTANGFITSNTGKSSAALMMAREWCKLIGIKFDPARHIAYSNSDVMAKIDLLHKFEPLVCVVGNTRVKIRHNGKEQTKKIRDLVGMKDYEVLSYNIKEDKFTWETPTRTQFSKRSEIYELELENGKTLRATPDHKVLTKNRGYVELQHLTTDDEVVCEKSKISNPKIIKPNIDLTDVYDIIDVGENHNFVANGVLVANCDEAIRFACVTGDTKIQLPCNREKYPDGVPIKELEGKRDFYVYSLNTKTNKIELKKSFGCRKTKNDYVYEVELRNGQKIKCTKEHRLLFIDGTYKTVEEIIGQQNKVWFEGGQSRKYIGGWRKALGVRIFNGISNTGYIRYNYNISRPCKMPEHRFIIEQLYDIKLTPNDIVHHDDDNNKNNEISNLQKVNKKHHNAIHNAPARKKYDSKTYGKNWQNHMRKKALIGDSITRMRKFDGDKAYFQSEEFKTKCIDNKKAHMKRRGQTWKDVYHDTNSKGGKYSYTTKVGQFIKSITKLGKEDVYDILGVEDNGNYIGNNIVMKNSSEEWSKKENKTLKKKLAEVRTKHLLYILCFPLKIVKLEKTYLESYTNYWCLTGDAKILTKDINNVIHYTPIKDLNKRHPKVLSYNKKTNTFEFNKYDKKIKTKKNAEVFEMELVNGQKIKCTAEHPFMTKHGWVQLKDLKGSDEILVAAKKCEGCGNFFVPKKQQMKWCTNKCKSKTKEYKEKNIKYHIEYRKNNIEQIKKKGHERYLKNREYILQQAGEYRKQNREKNRLYSINRRKNNPEHARKIDNDWRLKNHTHVIKKSRKRFNERYHNDIHFKIRTRVASRLRDVLNQQNTKKEKSVLKYLGCSIKEFKQYIAKQFTLGMSWKNHGKWHLDHIKPCAKFDLTKEDEIKKCFHYTNMQPLWAIDNMSKGDKYET